MEKQECYSIQNIEKFLELSPVQFDQDIQHGWRSLCENEKNIISFCLSNGKYVNNFLKAILVIEYYLDNKFFENESEKNLIVFHLAQIYATIGNRKIAIKYLNYLQKVGYKGVGKIYIEAIILFLEKNKNGLEKISMQINENEINYNSILKLIRNFDLDYFQAYSGKTYSQILEKLVS